MNEPIIRLESLQERQQEKRAGFCNTYGCDYPQTKVSQGWSCDLCGELHPFDEPNNVLSRQEQS